MITKKITGFVVLLLSLLVIVMLFLIGSQMGFIEPEHLAKFICQLTLVFLIWISALISTTSFMWSIYTIFSKN